MAWTLLMTSPAALAGAKAAASTLRVTELRGPGQPLSRRWIDLDADGLLDLVVVSASSSASTGQEEMRIETLIAYLNVTPFFLDRRQILIYRQTKEGFIPWGDPLPLTGDTAAVDVADIDGDGRPEILYAAGYRLFAFERKQDADSYSPVPRTLGDIEMLLGFTRSFLPDAHLTAALAKGAAPDFLLATPAGLEIRHPGPRGTLPSAADFVLRSGFRTIGPIGSAIQIYEPHPKVVDGDADGTLDLLFQRGSDVLLYRGEGASKFSRTPIRGDLAPGPSPGSSDGGGPFDGPEIEDIDADGLLDLVRVEETDPDEGSADGGKTKKKAKDRPVTKVEIRRGRPKFTFPDQPDLSLAVERTAKLQGGTAVPMRIDRDGRFDLVLVRFATSVWQIARFLVTKKISLAITFESMLQRPDGSFAPPRGKPFETKVTFDLKRGISGIPTMPRGDFDGDGITDLAEFTDAPELRIHTTTPDGVFPSESTEIVRLPREPEDRALVDILDLDGDGRSEVAFFNLDGPGFVGTVVRSGR